MWDKCPENTHRSAAPDFRRQIDAVFFFFFFLEHVFSFKQKKCTELDAVPAYVGPLDGLQHKKSKKGATNERLMI